MPEPALWLGSFVNAALPRTLREAIQRTERRLCANPELAPKARLDAQQLVEMATGRTRVAVLAAPDMPLSDEQERRLDSLVARRLLSEPIQYLRGSQEFFGRAFRVTPDVLIPRAETELLVEEALRRIPTETVRVADVGTGSGAIAITLALERPELRVTALDLSPGALAIAQTNAATLGVPVLEMPVPGVPVLGMRGERIRFLHSDLLDAAAGERFDAIVSNPPYVALQDESTLPAEVRKWEPSQALFSGADGLDLLRRLVPAAHAALVPGGLLLLETAGRSAALEELFSGWCTVEFIRDLQGVERFIAAQRPPEQG